MTQQPDAGKRQEEGSQSSEIKQNISRIEREIQVLEGEKVSLVRELPIKCCECKEKSSTKEWEFVQVLYFNSDACGLSRRDPLRCPIICPKCRKERYMDEYDYTIIHLILKYGAQRLFARIEERH